MICMRKPWPRLSEVMLWMLQMFRRGLIEPIQLKSLFEAIVPQLYGYPAIDPPAYRRAVEKTIAGIEKS